MPHWVTRRLAGVHSDTPLKHLGLINTDSIDHERGLLIASMILEVKVTFPRANDLKTHELPGGHGLVVRRPGRNLSTLVAQELATVVPQLKSPEQT